MVTVVSRVTLSHDAILHADQGAVILLACYQFWSYEFHYNRRESATGRLTWVQPYAVREAVHVDSNLVSCVLARAELVPSPRELKTAEGALREWLFSGFLMLALI